MVSKHSAAKFFWAVTDQGGYKTAQITINNLLTIRLVQNLGPSGPENKYVLYQVVRDHQFPVEHIDGDLRCAQRAALQRVQREFADGSTRVAQRLEDLAR